jgi:glycosyltransferase involved in cell wall biosynthesis
MRLLVWLKIFGSHPPQVIPEPLHAFADLLVATSPGTLALPEFAGRPAPVVFGLADFDRLAGCTPQAHAGFVAGYVGGLGPGKLHPDFVPMSAAARIPGARFLVCGSGAEPLRRQVQSLAAADRFDVRGYVENIRSILAGCDVFGYPLCPDTYATSEKALQEAMWVGIPPLVFPHGGVRCLVEDGVTGRVVATPAAYTAALEALYHAPEERRRLGANARDYARAAFDPQRAVGQLSDLYTALMQQPKRPRQWPGDGPTPAHWFVAALGEHAGPFARSLAGRDPEAEAAIAAASDLLFSGEGGIVHYRNAYPGDPHLQRWTSLALHQRGQLEQPAAGFQAVP